MFVQWIIVGRIRNSKLCYNRFIIQLQPNLNNQSASFRLYIVKQTGEIRQHTPALPSSKFKRFFYAYLSEDLASRTIVCWRTQVARPTPGASRVLAQRWKTCMYIRIQRAKGHKIDLGPLTWKCQFEKADIRFLTYHFPCRHRKRKSDNHKK